MSQKPNTVVFYDAHGYTEDFFLLHPDAHDSPGPHGMVL